MALATYTDLQTSVAGWLNRPDLTAQIPDFITLAETRLNRDLDNARAMETKVTLTTPSDGSNTVAAPADLLEMQRLLLLDSQNVVLQYLTPDEFAARHASNRSGRPEDFTVTGGSIELGPTPDAAYTLQLSYFQKLPSLAANGSNWLLSAWPDAYLWATLCAAQPFLMNDGRLPTFERLYAQAVQSINSVEWYSGTTMRVKAR